MCAINTTINITREHIGQNWHYTERSKWFVYNVKFTWIMVWLCAPRSKYSCKQNGQPKRESWINVMQFLHIDIIIIIKSENVRFFFLFVNFIVVVLLSGLHCIGNPFSFCTLIIIPKIYRVIRHWSCLASQIWTLTRMGNKHLK